MEGAAGVQGPVELGARLGDGEVPLAGEHPAVTDKQLLSPLGIDPITLVERHVHRGPAMAQQIHDEAIPPARRFAAIHQEQHHIHFANGAAGALHQPFAEEMVGLVDPGRIQQHQLGAGGGQDRPQPVAGGLGDGGGDRHLGAHQLVQQGGFTHVGPADQGDKPGAKPLRRAPWALGPQARQQAGRFGRIGDRQQLAALDVVGVA